MSVALRKADGDLFIDQETGRGEEVSGPTKVDQEMFSCYVTDFDPERNWGSKLQVKYFQNISSFVRLRASIYSELTAANRRILAKQGNDPFLNQQTEKILEFDRADVFIDPTSQSGLFISSARVGEANTIVGKQLFIDFKPISIRHVLPPPFATGLSFFK